MGYRGVLSLAEAVVSPEIEASLEMLQRIGRELREWNPKIAFFFKEIENLGFPPIADNTVALAPYDVIADNLRGMRGTMMDLFKHPDELLEACDSVLRAMLLRIGMPVEGALNNVS